jgi:hypothetical protein
MRITYKSVNLQSEKIFKRVKKTESTSEASNMQPSQKPDSALYAC